MLQELGVSLKFRNGAMVRRRELGGGNGRDLRV